MLVFTKKNLVFLSQPKTGTTAFSDGLGAHASWVINDPPGLKHTSLFRYQRFFLPLLQKTLGIEPETLGVIRHPEDWLGSWFRYRSRPALDGHPNSTKGLTFDQFVVSYLQGKQPKYAQVGDQAKFLSPLKDHAPITHVFQYEQQDMLHQFLSARLGLDIALPQRNVSPKAELELSNTIRQKLERKCADQYELWSAAYKDN